MVEFNYEKAKRLWRKKMEILFGFVFGIMFGIAGTVWMYNREKQ
jgi:hypothetical protein